MSFIMDAANESGTYVKFDDSNMNQPIEMEITDTYSIRAAQYKGELRKTQKGKQKWEMVIPVKVNGQDMIFSDSTRRNLLNAMAEALRSAGVRDLEIGGVLTVTYKGKVPQGNFMAGAFDASYKRAEGDNVELATPSYDPRTDPQNVPAAAPQQQPMNGGFQAPQGNQFQRQPNFQQQNQQQGQPNFGNQQQPNFQQGGNFQQYDGPSQNANQQNPWG